MTLCWGIAATGRIARTVGSVMAAHPDMRVVAVGSRSPERAAALAAELGAARSYGTYDELVHDPAVDAVYVATPHAQHAGVVEAALRAGRAVLCEKPLTASLAETERLTALALETGSFLMEAMWMRFNPLVRSLGRIVRDGGLGDVRSLHAAFGFAAPFDPAGRLWDPVLGGGALLDLGVYVIDLARLLLGDPESVSATGTPAPTGVDAQATVQLGWAGGACGLLDVSLLTALPGTALVTGTAGYAELGPAFHAPTRLLVHVDGVDRVEELPDRNAGFVGEIEEVARCVNAGKAESEVLPLAETVATMRVIERARQLVSAPARG